MISRLLPILCLVGLFALPATAQAQVALPEIGSPPTPNEFGQVIVVPQVRIPPEQPLWNAYSNPLTAPHRTPPWIRDNDGDGIPNAFDYDDNKNPLQTPSISQQLLPPKD